MKLQRIQGTIEVLGQSEFDNVGTAYGYIRFADANGKVTMHDNIIVLNNCNSYLKPGLSGVFYLSRFCRGQILYGLRIPGRIAEDTKLAGQIRTSLLFKVYWPLVLGLLGIFIIIGSTPRACAKARNLVLVLAEILMFSCTVRPVARKLRPSVCTLVASISGLILGRTTGRAGTASLSMAGLPSLCG